jgi:hypothetical protein
LVLDTDSELATLLWKARDLESLIPDTPVMLVDKFPHTVMDMVAQIVMESIHYERTARDELNFACAEMFLNELGSSCEDSYRRFAGLLNRFGEEVLEKLRMMRAYQNGYLYYQFHDWLGRDMVLRHLHAEHIPNL